MYIKIHKQQDKEMISFCDEDLIGKTLEEGEIIMEILESFFKGKKSSDKETESILKKSNNINIVGEKSIKFCL